MSRYADIVKKPTVERPADRDQLEPVTVVNEQPRVEFTRPPEKKGSLSYDSWEYAYFPYLNEMYKIFYDEYNAEAMYNFFRFIYYVSSGEISKYLRKFSSEEEAIYSKYLIKRNRLSIKNE